MTEPGDDEPDTDADPDDRSPGRDPSPATDRSDGTPFGAPEQAPGDPNRQEAGTQDGGQSPSSEQRGEDGQGTTAAGSDSTHARRSRKAGGREQRSERESDSWTLVVRDVTVTVLAVLLVGAYLFAISGVWPPMVAIESGSMEPNMDVNDMVFVMDEGRFQPAAATGDTGVVTARTGDGTGYGEFGNSGDVIIYEPGGSDAETPIIHRAIFWVEEGENWCEQGNPEYLGSLQPDDAVCEADHDGFITKGDANSNYDQASIGRATGPVRPEWIIGTAELRLPRLGWFRLQF